jgi:hypothetical protein
MKLQFPAGALNRVVVDVDVLLDAYRTDDGLRYLEYSPLTPSDRLVPEDLAVTILINSRVGPAAFKSVQDRAHEASLDNLARWSLEESDDADRAGLAELIAQIASWPGFASSVATKILHKKRPDLIPILDNQAIFGAYMNPKRPEHRSSMESVYAVTQIKEALDWIWSDLTRQENIEVWPRLKNRAPRRSLVEIFDMIWWMHLRELESVRPVSPI